jgi:hypothetical protein
MTPKFHIDAGWSFCCSLQQQFGFTTAVVFAVLKLEQDSRSATRPYDILVPRLEGLCSIGVEYVMCKPFSEYWRDLANAGQMVMIYS